MKTKAELEIDELMKKKSVLEHNLNIIVQQLRLTVIKNSILNVTSNNATNGR